jgi:predicted PurR-regulated permease PerM
MTSETVETGARSASAADLDGVGFLPGWMRRMAAMGWRLLAVAGIIAVGIAIALALSTTTEAILVAAIVSATVAPLVSRLRARGWGRSSAAGAASVLALVGVLAVVLLIVLAFLPYVVQLSQTARDAISAVIARLTALGVPAELLDPLRTFVSGFDAWLTNAFSELVGPVASVVTALILGGFLTFYVLQDGDRGWAQLTGDLNDQAAGTLTARVVTAVSEVGGYLRAMATIAVIDSVADFVYLTILGVPLAGPLSVMVFLGAFIPYIGTIFTTIVIVTVTLAAAGTGPAAVLLALIIVTTFAANTFVDRNVYTGSRVHPAVVLVVVPAGAALFGIGGLFFAVPVAATLIILVPAIIQALEADAEHDAAAEAAAEGRPARPPRRPFVPLWLDRMGQFSWRALVILAFLWVVGQAIVLPFLSAPVVIALVASCAMWPSTDFLRTRGITPSLAALAVSIVAAAIIAIILTVTLVSLVNQLPELLGDAGAAADRLGWGDSLGKLVQTFGGGILSGSGNLVSNLGAVFAALASAALLTFFFLRDGPDWWGRLLQRVDPSRRVVIGDTGAEAARILNGSTVGTGVVSLIGGTAWAVLMTILGLPLAVPVGVLTFFGGFIPYVGGFIATGVALLVAIAVGDTTDIVVMAIFTPIYNIAIGNFVAPLVYGKTVSLHPAVVLMAAPIGAAIGGLVGMFLIVPVIAIVGATWRPIVHLFDPDDGTQPAAAPNDRTRQAAAAAAAASRPAPASSP